MRLLLAAGADPNRANLYGWTPLDMLAFRMDTVPVDVAAALETARHLVAVAENKTVADKATAEMRRGFRSAQRRHEKGGLSAEELQLYRNLFALLSVSEPLPPRTLAPGEPITVTSSEWKRQYSELWQMLVPEGGHAESVQGEVIRIAGRVGYEILNNGGGNWDRDFEAMLDAFAGMTANGQPLGADDQAVVTRARQAPRGGRFSEPAVNDLTRTAVAWVLLNPDRVPLPPPPYQR